MILSFYQVELCVYVLLLSDLTIFFPIWLFSYIRDCCSKNQNIFSKNICEEEIQIIIFSKQMELAQLPLLNRPFFVIS